MNTGLRLTFDGLSDIDKFTVIKMVYNRHTLNSDLCNEKFTASLDEYISEYLEYKMPNMKIDYSKFTNTDLIDMSKLIILTYERMLKVHNLTKI